MSLRLFACSSTGLVLIIFLLIVEFAAERSVLPDDYRGDRVPTGPQRNPDRLDRLGHDDLNVGNEIETGDGAEPVERMSVRPPLRLKEGPR